jgi:hypothetical protein
MGQVGAGGKLKEVGARCQGLEVQQRKRRYMIDFAIRLAIMPPESEADLAHFLGGFATGSKVIRLSETAKAHSDLIKKLGQ